MVIIVRDIVLLVRILLFKLLQALNAAIEVTWADDYEKGSLVIASEVGKLAKISKTADEGIVQLPKQSVNLSTVSHKKNENLNVEIKNLLQLVFCISSLALNHIRCKQLNIFDIVIKK